MQCLPMAFTAGSRRHRATVILLYININHHVGEPKQTQTRYTVFLDQEFRTTVQYYYGIEKDNIKNEVWCCFFDDHDFGAAHSGWVFVRVKNHNKSRLPKKVSCGVVLMASTMLQ